jgi:hypothetical protein
MSIWTKPAALAFGAPAVFAVASLDAGAAQAEGYCYYQHHRGPCIGAQIGGGSGLQKCYWLPTASNGRVTGVQRVCS